MNGLPIILKLYAKTFTNIAVSVKVVDHAAKAILLVNRHKDLLTFSYDLNIFVSTWHFHRSLVLPTLRKFQKKIPKFELSN